MEVDEGSSVGLGMSTASNIGSSVSIPIDSSNIGFQVSNYVFFSLCSQFLAYFDFVFVKFVPVVCVGFSDFDM